MTKNNKSFTRFSALVVVSLVYRGIKTKFVTVKKPSVTYEGLALDEVEMSPVVNLSDMFDRFANNEPIGDLIDEAEHILRHVSIPEPFGKKATSIFDWDIAKDRLMLSVLGYETNKDYLADKVYVLQEDIAILPRVLVNEDMRETATVAVTEKMVEAWGITKEDLLTATIKSSKKLFPIQAIDLKEEFGEEFKAPFIPLTTRKPYGAAALFYSGVMTSLFDEYGDFYVLPSSIHEVLILPSLNMDISNEELRQLVEDVNGNEWAMPDKTDILTNSVYKYDGISFKKVV